MIRLQIENFSVIKSADFELAKANILIGPQASGKSVISKLLYFFLESITGQYEYIQKEASFDKYGEEFKERFSTWFPTLAWGNSKFKIQFEAGDYKVYLTRTSYSSSIKNNLRLWTSPLVKSHYVDMTAAHKKLGGEIKKRAEGDYIDRYQLRWRLIELAYDDLSKSLKKDFVRNQTFIPAGRSFFTNLGRAFMAFDQGRMLDPITVQFGRLYGSFHDEMRYFRYNDRVSRQFDSDLADILGGDVVWEDETAFVQCPDGRKIPFSALSSGQQELFPLVVALRAVIPRGEHKKNSRSQKENISHLLYIEEPEAHLFPSAQSTLLQGLVSVANEAQGNRLLLTTHSPYVLSKLNNLIKAGALEKSLADNRRGLLHRVIPRRSQIAPGEAHAYAIVDGVLQPIIDDDGLIAADYLDNVSGQIGEEFSKLLQLESET